MASAALLLAAQCLGNTGVFTVAMTEREHVENPADQFEMNELFAPLVELLSHLNPEEFLLLLFTLWPLSLGAIATLHVLTGHERSSLDAASGDEESGDVGSIAKSMHNEVANSTEAMQTCIFKVETQIVDLQRAHDTRFADLHKDLAGIVWELSKLRADMARWQALSQLGARGAKQGSQTALPVGAAAAAKPAESAGGESPPPVPLTRGASGVAATGAGAVEAPGGARAWRGDGQ